ncbi:hypothetical protein RvY_05707-2 [Ramazzottius varieornatus]|uniref:DNA topoisomerase n=1 Tax=Ramazzottius varieornatus TaxID=947166 RepID=A0A1D1V4Y8_RAMVA|nr:hypothetical protein RvY_05707-2 [Ramazzottius varieornatus]
MREVLMVAEKPNLAQTISGLLSNDSARKGCIDRRLSKGLPLYEWSGPWPATGELVHYKMTSTYGHVCQIDFEPLAQDWNVDPEQLFSCGIVKKERDEQARVSQQLASAGRHADFLVLWLDCDKEGENICFEVMDAVVPVMNSRPEMQRVYRALFSALTEADVKDAFHQLRTPNHNESLSVDARMELDLRIGCAFTRFQTKTLKKKYGRETLNTDTVPYGPCQTPTLSFCVERYKSMRSFVGQPYFRVNVAVLLPDGSLVPLEWKRKRTFDSREAQSIVQRVLQAHNLCVSDVRAEERRKGRPSALNTVQMLRLASSQLRMSPNHTMELAERLYMEGFISYPRTETTQYPNSFDRLSTLSSITGRDELGQYAERLIYDMPSGGPSGQDRGDHPPIVPLKRASPKLMNDNRAYGLYQLICANVLASLSADCTYLEKTVSFDVAGERFQMEGIEVLDEGFTEVLKHLKMRSRNIPRLNIGNYVTVKSAQVKEEVTKAPELLTESDLIDLMEKHGIGTDASIPVHIQSVFKRNFVTLTEDRRILPTPMGIAMIDGYNALDDDLSKPQIRSTLEKDLTLIAASHSTTSNTERA